MLACSYCAKQINREVFCSESHRVMFFRRKKKGLTTNPIVYVLKKAEREYKKEERTVDVSKRFTLCKKHHVYRDTCKCS